MIQVALDFAPGLHGHFLELVLNRYIYGINLVKGKIFYSTGAAHAINTDNEYQDNKIVDRGHFSSFKKLYRNSVNKIIFIDHYQELDFVLLTNIYYRCHPDSTNVEDFNIEIIKEMHQKNLMHGTEVEFRNNWFAKLNERLFVEYTKIRPRSKHPIYNFDYKSFFDLNDFCVELQKTAHFLEETFKFDTSLADLWHEFIKRNQGWNLYQQAESILISTISNQNLPIPNDWKLHAYLNFRLSKMFNIHDGLLYNSETYPSTTLQLLAVIQEHVANFDNRW